MITDKKREEEGELHRNIMVGEVKEREEFIERTLMPILHRLILHGPDGLTPRQYKTWKELKAWFDLQLAKRSGEKLLVPEESPLVEEE